MKKYIISLISLSVLFFATPALAGLGISPSDWVEPNGLAGQTMEKVFTLSRGNPDTDLYFTSEITGDIIPYITIANGNSFVMPKGQQEFPVKIMVAIPKDAAHKEYKSEIRLKSESKEAPKPGAAPIGVLLSSLIRIDLTVSDKRVLSYQVLQVNIATQEINKPLNLAVKIWNEGNVEAKPTKITLDIFDKFNTTKLDSKTITDFSLLAGVGSFSEGTINVPIPIDLQPEQYWAKINVYQDDKMLKTDDITFDIVKEFPKPQVVATTPLPAPQSNSWFSVDVLSLMSFILADILFIIIGILILIRKISGRSRVSQPKEAENPIPQTQEIPAVKEIEKQKIDITLKK